MVLFLAAWALPLGPLRPPVRKALRPPLSVLGLDASWDFYAPNPATGSIDVYANVLRPDGSRERYDFPDTTDNFVGTYWTARWAEYEESLAFNPSLRSLAAARIARETTSEVPITAVEILLRRAPTGRWSVGDPLWGPEELLYRLDLNEAE